MSKALQKEHDVTLLMVNAYPEDPESISHLEAKFESVHSFTFPKTRFHLNALKGLISRRPLQTHYYQFSEVNNWLNQHISGFDLLYCNHVRTAEYGREYDVPKVIDLVDAISRNYQAAKGVGGPFQRLVFPIEAPRLLRYERKMIEEFDAAFITTEDDKKHMVESEEEENNVIIVPNGVEKSLTFETTSEVTKTGDIVFVGKMDYFPNEDAVRFFAQEIFPNIRERYQNSTFRIVGTNPSRRVNRLGQKKGVVVTGFVDSTVEYMKNSQVVVVPIRHGAGIQNKLLQAMALGKPVVTTPLGASGIKGQSGKHFIIASNADDFAKEVMRLMSDDRERAKIGIAARQLVRENYTWSTATKPLRSTVDRVLEFD